MGENCSAEGENGARKSTGVIYDMRMVEHRCLWDEGYPEKPERFSAIIQRCNELSLFDRCVSLSPRFATEDELTKIHSEEHIEKLRGICKRGISNEKGVDLEKLEYEASLYDYVYFHPSTYDLSLLATGCTIDLVNAILNKEIQNGMAIIRPPGHHAMKSEYCGYCYFNNVAIAAKNALDSGKAKKILIVDFDVHHGQATQQAFYNDKRVLYFSTHRFDHGEFWPNLEESNYNFIGAGEGEGYNVNIPLNKGGMGNSEFVSVWHNILIPVAYQFNPDLIIVSAGYDAAVGCFEGECDVTPQCYPHLIRPLMGLANGKVAVILEGGYCLQSLAEGAALTLRTLLGDPCPLIEPLTQPDQVLVDSVLNSAYMLQRQWKNLSKVRYVEQPFNDDNCHVPQLKFEWNEPKPTVHQTRDCYPIQSDELKKEIKERLDNLTETTSLEKAVKQVCVVENLGLGMPKGSEHILTIDKPNVSKEYATARLFKERPSESIGFTLATIENVLLGKSQSGVTTVSPSEIEAVSEVAMSYALDEFKLQRILFIDLGLHPELVREGRFLNDSRVLKISLDSTRKTIAHSNEQDYSVADCEVDETGRYVVNIPFNIDELGDAECLAAFSKIILPIAYQFNPQLVLVSGGFGGIAGQELGITGECYAHIIHLLSTLANGKLVFLLANDYVATATETIGLVIKALLGDPLPRIKSPISECNPSSAETFQNVLNVYSRYWSILTPFVKSVPLFDEDLIPIGKY